ncbi:MAG: N-acetylmuramoyl-L-alanine amidase [Tannerellaceae bacterium]
MSNSPLVTYTKLSPNYGARTKKIRKITPHHMAGKGTVEQCGEGFAARSRKASANYGIDSVGHVGMYVEEKNRSWASSSTANDDEAITIEVANDEVGGQWHVSDVALAKLIDLCEDICRRNGIEKLVFTGDKKGNLTQHNYFAATACPGPYLKSKFPYIAEQVNARLGGAPATPATPSPVEDAVKLPYKVRVIASELNIRSGPGTKFTVTGSIKDKGVYTIIAVQNGWGKLKSGAGWISLSFTQKV